MLTHGSTFEPGMKLDDRVELVEMIGTGASGSVFKAKQQGMDRAVAVKVLHQTALYDKEHVARFFREAKVISALSHPNIVKVYAVGMAEDRQPYMVMDYIEGQTLADLISERKLSANDYLDVFIQVAAALSHAHQSEVVHRDIKPRNILIQRDAEKKNKCVVKLADFGIARNVVPTTVQRITKAGVIIGSPIYMSPEQCTGRAVDHRTDLYSLGCVMFEAASGAVPFNDKNAAGLIGKHVMEPAPSLDGRIVIPELSPDVAKVVAVLLNKKAEDRYPDAETLRQDLETIQNGSQPPFASTAVMKRSAPVKTEPERTMTGATITVIVGTMVAIAIFFAARWVTASSMPDSEGNPAALHQIAKICMHAAPHMERKEYKEAQQIYQHAYQICKDNKIGGKVFADVCMSRAYCEWHVNNLQSANDLFAIAYDYYQKTNNKRQLVELSRYWGSVCLGKGDPQKASELLAVAWAAFESDQVPTSIYSKIGVLNELCKAYTKAGKPYSAVALYPKLIQMEKNYKELPELCAPTHEQYAVALSMVGRDEEAQAERKIAQEFMDEQKRVEDRILAK